jgi:hypothetical protein
MTPILMIVGLLAIVWASVLLFRGSTIYGCLFFMLACACLGRELFAVKVGGIDLALDRVLPPLLLAGYFVQRRLGLADPKPWTRVDTLLGVFTGLLVVSTLTHPWTTVSEPSITPPLWRLTISYLLPLLVYWIARQSRLSATSMNVVYGSTILFGVYLAVTALFEVNDQWWAVFPRYIANPKLGDHFGRARGPLLDSVAFGFTMSVCLVTAWACRARLSRAAQLVIFALSGLMLVAIYLSYTRSAWMGAAAALVVMLGLTAKGAWRPLLLGSALTALLLATVLRFDNLVAFEREYSAEGTRESATLRPVIAYVSWKMFLDHPLFGCGFGQYYQAKNFYLDDRDSDLVLERARPFQHHNLFLALLVDTGLIGVGLYLAILALWARNAWELWHSQQTPPWARPQALLFLGVLAAYLPNALFHDVSHTNYVQLLLYFTAGVTAGLRPLAGPAPAHGWRWSESLSRALHRPAAVKHGPPAGI